MHFIYPEMYILYICIGSLFFNFNAVFIEPFLNTYYINILIQTYLLRSSRSVSLEIAFELIIFLKCIYNILLIK